MTSSPSPANSPPRVSLQSHSTAAQVANAGIRRLNVAPAKFDWLTTEEANRFLKAIDAHYPAWRPLFWLALRTGLRRGELFALK